MSDYKKIINFGISLEAVSQMFHRNQHRYTRDDGSLNNIKEREQMESLMELWERSLHYAMIYNEDFMAEMKNEYETKGLIHSVKLMRCICKTGIKTSKDMVEKIAAEHSWVKYKPLPVKQFNMQPFSL